MSGPRIAVVLCVSVATFSCVLPSFTLEGKQCTDSADCGGLKCIAGTCGGSPGVDGGAVEVDSLATIAVAGNRCVATRTTTGRISVGRYAADWSKVSTPWQLLGTVDAGLFDDLSVAPFGSDGCLVTWVELATQSDGGRYGTGIVASADFAGANHVARFPFPGAVVSYGTDALDLGEGGVLAAFALVTTSMTTYAPIVVVRLDRELTAGVPHTVLDGTEGGTTPDLKRLRDGGLGLVVTQTSLQKRGPAAYEVILDGSDGGVSAALLNRAASGGFPAGGRWDEYPGGQAFAWVETVASGRLIRREVWSGPRSSMWGLDNSGSLRLTASGERFFLVNEVAAGSDAGLYGTQFTEDGGWSYLLGPDTRQSLQVLEDPVDEHVRVFWVTPDTNAPNRNQLVTVRVALPLP